MWWDTHMKVIWRNVQDYNVHIVQSNLTNTINQKQLHNMPWYSQDNQTMTTDGTQSQNCTNRASLVYPHMASEVSAVTHTQCRHRVCKWGRGTDTEILWRKYENRYKFLVTLVVWQWVVNDVMCCINVYCGIWICTYTKWTQGLFSSITLLVDCVLG